MVPPGQPGLQQLPTGLQQGMQPGLQQTLPGVGQPGGPQVIHPNMQQNQQSMVCTNLIFPPQGSASPEVADRAATLGEAKHCGWKITSK